MSGTVSDQLPYFTLGEAAKRAGVSKPTLSKAISTGRLSAEKQPDGSVPYPTGGALQGLPTRKPGEPVRPGRNLTRGKPG